MCNSDSISESDQFSRKQNDYFDNNNYQLVLQNQEDYQLVSDQQNSQISNADLNSTFNTQISMIKEKLSTEERLTKLEQNFENFKGEIKGEISNFKGEIKGEISNFKGEIKGEISNFKEEIRGEISKFSNKLDAIFKFLRISQHDIIQKSAYIQENKKYQPGSLDKLVIDKDINRHLNMIFDANSFSQNEPVLALLHSFRKIFSKKFQLYFNPKMLQFNQHFQEIQVTQLQLALLLPFCYYLLCQYKNFEKLICKKGAITILYIIDYTQSKKGNKNIMIEQSEEIGKIYQKFKKQCMYATGVLGYIHNFLDKIGFKDFCKDERAKKTISRNIIALFLSSYQNLWRYPSQVFMAITLRTLKTLWDEGYDHVRTLAKACRYINLEKTEKIMQILHKSQQENIVRHQR